MGDLLPNLNSATILVVEDEDEIRELISIILSRKGFSVLKTGRASEVNSILEKHDVSMVILDWMLPETSGIDFLKKFNKSIPVLMLTAKSEPEDIVMGLESGADDYLTKPFDSSVLIARVNALLRRQSREVHGVVDSEELSFSGIKINKLTYEVSAGNQKLHLTPSEFKIVLEMAENVGCVLTREHFISIVQGEGVTVTGRTVDTHIFGLRKKLGKFADAIETIRGVGYRAKND